MSRVLLNNSLWVASLLLQCALLVLVFIRRLARVIPFFAALIGFYVCRSALLPVLGGRLAPPTYATISGALSLLDLALQFLVAVEIARHVLKVVAGCDTRRRLLLMTVTVAGLSLATYFFAGLFPAKSPIPADRLQIFNSLTLVLLGVSVVYPGVSNAVRHLAAGFAVFSLVSLATSVFRSTAAAHRDTVSFTQGSYANSLAWLAVLAYWIVFLKPDSKLKSPLVDG